MLGDALWRGFPSEILRQFCVLRLIPGPSRGNVFHVRSQQRAPNERVNSGRRSPAARRASPSAQAVAATDTGGRRRTGRRHRGARSALWLPEPGLRALSDHPAQPRCGRAGATGASRTNTDLPDVFCPVTTQRISIKPLGKCTNSLTSGEAENKLSARLALAPRRAVLGFSVPPGIAGVHFIVPQTRSRRAAAPARRGFSRILIPSRPSR